MTDPARYAGYDLNNLRRLTAAGWALGIALTVACLVVAPPTAEIGSAGWAVAAGVELVSLAGLVALRLWPERAGFDALLAAATLAVAKTALLQWLSGGWVSPLDQILLLAILMGSAGHPPRRAVPFVVYVLCAALLPAVYDPDAGELQETVVHLTTWVVVAAFCIAIMERVRAQRVRESGLARSDALTQLANRRAFDEAADAAGGQGAVTLAIGDLDGFKDVNDCFGHLAGDRCLADVAATLADHARAGDEVFRWGGDEFAVLLRCGSDDEASRLCARLERAVAMGVRRPDGRPVGITFGWATAESDADVRALVVAADEALLARKRGLAPPQPSAA